MGDNSAIEWTGDTANVVVVKGEDGKQKGWYCVKCSEGCANCYAEALNMSGRFNGNGLPYKVLPNEEMPELMLRTDIMEAWSRKRRARVIFVNSMTDTFGEFVPKEWIFQILDAMLAAPLHIYQLLTKRAARQREVINEYCDLRGIEVLPDFIWIGISAENQKRLDERLHDLLHTRTSIRWISAEPLLGLLTFPSYAIAPRKLFEIPYHLYDVAREIYLPRLQEITLGGMQYTTVLFEPARIDWIVVGGESGKRARPMHPDWARHIRAQCLATGVPLFFKQWGNWQDVSPIELPESYDRQKYMLIEKMSGDMIAAPTLEEIADHYFNSGKNWRLMRHGNKRAHGAVLDGVEHKQFPQMERDNAPID